MKIVQTNLDNALLIGDVHSSPEHLNRVLEAAEWEKVVFLGDLVDRGPDPCAVIETVWDLHKAGKALVIMGNHDWKFVRWFNGQTKVSMKEEQQATLDALTDDHKKMFMDIFGLTPIIGAWDPNHKVMLGHAAAGRPIRIFEKCAARLTQELKEDITADDLIAQKAVSMSKNVGSRFLYGIVNGGQVDERGFPLRMPITKSADDDLGGWTFIHGHTHAKELNPEQGNKHIVCLDWACGEPGGKLAGMLFTDVDCLTEDNIIFSE